MEKSKQLPKTSSDLPGKPQFVNHDVEKISANRKRLRHILEQHTEDSLIITDQEVVDMIREDRDR